MDKPRLIGVCGLPGSGKTTLFTKDDYRGFLQIDDIGKKWRENESWIRDKFATGISAIVSDIEFCNLEECQKFERRIGIPVEWLYFENNPLKCAVNCLYRFYTKRNDRPLHQELRKIKRLTHQYHTHKFTIPVTQQSIEGPAWECAISCLHRFYCLDDRHEDDPIGELIPDISRIKELGNNNLLARP